MAIRPWITRGIPLFPSTPPTCPRVHSLYHVLRTPPSPHHSPIPSLFPPIPIPSPTPLSSSRHNDDNHDDPRIATIQRFKTTLRDTAVSITNEIVKELENESFRIRRLQPPPIAESLGMMGGSMSTHTLPSPHGSPKDGRSPFVSMADLANMTTQERQKYEAEAAASMKRNLMRNASTGKVGSPMHSTRGGGSPTHSRPSSRSPSPRGRGSSVSPWGSANNLVNLVNGAPTNLTTAPSSSSIHNHSATMLTNDHNQSPMNRKHNLTPIKSIHSPSTSPSGSRRELARLANNTNNNRTNSIKQSSINHPTAFGSRQFNSSLIGGLNGGSLEQGLPQITRIWTPHEINMQKVIQRRGGELYILTAAGTIIHPDQNSLLYTPMLHPKPISYFLPLTLQPPIKPPLTPYQSPLIGPHQAQRAV